MKVALIYPPTCDPTGPYLSVPMLTAYLREQGIEVLPIDANIEAYDRLLCRTVLTEMTGAIDKRLARLDQKSSLRHSDQLLYARLWEVMTDLAWVPEEIEDAIAVLRDGTGLRFFDPCQYERAIRTTQAALRIISAAYSPLQMDFTSYRTPFSLLTLQQVQTDALAANNPFHHYFSEDLSRLLAQHAPDLIGISLAFPGQIQVGYTLANILRQAFPETHITVGGPAITQIWAGLDAEKIPGMLGPFHSTVLYEGEETLLNIVRELSAGKTPPQVLYGRRNTKLDRLPPPDFEGLPLNKYLSPELVLPYDPTRGCYWGKCNFCHYGLSPMGTSVYRERPVDQVVAHLKYLKERWNCCTFYFSQDAFAPRTAAKLARALKAADLSLQWATDMRPEPELTRESCRDLKAGGALSIALGVETASPRVLRLIDKGLSVRGTQRVIKNLAAAGIAVEAMCFTDFPTETYQDAMLTLAFIQDHREQIALFVCGRFGLCHGSRVAHHPEAFGLRQIWHLQGDEFQTGLFYEERLSSKTEGERERLDREISSISQGWWLHDYPWAGALSTAHTLLWYSRDGREVFKRLADTPRRIASQTKTSPRQSRFDIVRIIRNVGRHEAEIWQALIYDRKAVSRKLYQKYCRQYPPERPIRIHTKTFL